MTPLILTIIAAFIAALALTPLAKRLAVAAGAVDRPGGGGGSTSARCRGWAGSPSSSR